MNELKGHRHHNLYIRASVPYACSHLITTHVSPFPPARLAKTGPFIIIFTLTVEHQTVLLVKGEPPSGEELRNLHFPHLHLAVNNILQYIEPT